MNWTIVAAVILFVVISLVVRASAGLKAEQAHELLAQGAIVIDVRSKGEFAAKSIDGVINIPLSELAARILKAVPDKNRIVLLHCRSGSRSGHGTRILKQLGYDETYNLGSFGHARKVIETAGAVRTD
ncbi:MAG: rhodanese-like domain-containing protein [Verrucomicrobia bacterium]|nr:MAG: rhodanese-like domain-containing protein [Verrucomicrobiota bacterium]